MEKTSYGIACCRNISGIPEILLIRKRVTFAFSEFTNMNFNIYDDNVILRLLNAMTTDEKIDILSLNFAQIWYRMWLSTKPNSKFCKFKQLFDKAFYVDNGVRLKRLISISKCGNYIWEIPKGHREDCDAAPMITAIREFCEETNIDKTDYRIIANRSIKISFIDENVTYTYIYYIAAGDTHTIGSITLNNLLEVSEIRWMNLNEIKLIDYNARLEPIAARALKMYKVSL